MLQNKEIVHQIGKEKKIRTSLWNPRYVTSLHMDFSVIAVRMDAAIHNIKMD
jgi:hypothetical protein